MLLYNLGIYLYYIAIRMAAPFNSKARLWVAGRKNWRRNLSAQLAAIGDRPRVWVHCASLGEFEQGRPIIEAIKEQYPAYAIILSFFSPSGYEVRKDYDKADLVCYLPLDTRTNAAYFIEIVKPRVALFIKYEFWINYLQQLRANKVDTYIVSAVFRPQQPFFKWYGGIFRRSLKAFTTLFVQDKQSLKQLQTIGINNAMVCGDTRFDRVIQVKEKFSPIPAIEQFKGGSRLIVAGSTWPGDEDIVLAAFDKLREQDIKLVLVPHDIEDKLLKNTITKIKKYRLSYSLYTAGPQPGASVLVLDTVGLLSSVYHYADVSYIGGGFDGGLHNCLEAAVYGRPVSFFGKEFVKYNEAVELVKMGAAANVNDKDELFMAWQRFLNDEGLRMDIMSKTTGYFKQNADATQKVLKEISFE